MQPGLEYCKAQKQSLLVTYVIHFHIGGSNMHFRRNSQGFSTSLIDLRSDELLVDKELLTSLVAKLLRTLLSSFLIRR